MYMTREPNLNNFLTAIRECKIISVVSERSLKDITKWALVWNLLQTSTIMNAKNLLCETKATYGR